MNSHYHLLHIPKSPFLYIDLANLHKSQYIMSIDSRLWHYASDSIVSGIGRNQKELDDGLEFQDQVDTYTTTCKTMALQGKMMHGGSEVEEEEALRHWNNLYTNLQNSISPSPEDESTSLAETLASQYLHLKQLTEEFMQSRNDPAWVKNTIETVRSDAVSEREKAISNMFEDIKTLDNKYESNGTREDPERLSHLSGAAQNYAERARKVNGPTVDLITVSQNGLFHDGMQHDQASRFMGEMSYHFRKTQLEPLAVSSTFKNEDLIGSIADSVHNIETSTNKILFAHQQLGDTGEEQCGNLDRRIFILDLELRDAENLYEAYEEALVDERREESL